jgi:hypothetical protein
MSIVADVTATELARQLGQVGLDQSCYWMSGLLLDVWEDAGLAALATRNLSTFPR